MNDTIIALATPPIKSALALLRISGGTAIGLTEEFLGKKIDISRGRTIISGYFSDKDKKIDQVVAFIYPSPKSFTGEDMVEISCHGSMLIVNEIISIYLSKGVRQASGGEFSARAFYNGKIDLIEAEAINDLINASTLEAKQLALLSLSGETSAIFTPIKEAIADLLSLVEVNIDYPEYEDIEQANTALIAAKCSEISLTISKLIKEGEEGLIIRNGIKVAIIGRPNVGKSTLLNALLKEEKAIVSSTPGTTRDVVEGEISIKGIAIKFLDTAGIRESSEDYIESLGMDKSRKTIEEADLVILLHDATTNDDTNEFNKLLLNKKVINAYNKADLIKDKNDNKLYISSLNKEVEPLKEAIFLSLGLSDSSFNNPSFGNVRELTIMKKMVASLNAAKEDADKGLPVDLISINLHSAYNEAKELLGEEASHDYQEEIFSRFCVGK